MGAWKPRRERRLVSFFVLVDAAALAVSTMVAVLISEAIGREGSASAIDFVWWALATVVLVILAATFQDLYERDRRHVAVSTLDEVHDFFTALTFVGFVELTLGRLPGLDDVFEVGHVPVLLFWALGLVCLPAARGAFRHLGVPLLNNPQPTIIVGAGHVGQTIALKILKHRSFNTRLVGFLDDHPQPLDPELNGLAVLGGEDDLVEVIRRTNATRVILAFSRRSHEGVVERIRESGLKDIHLSIVPRYFELMSANVGLTDVEGIPLIDLPAAGLSRFARFTKRAFDLALTLPGFLVVLPVFVAIAIAIKLDTRGPVFFRQPRMGRGHRVFHIIKFRTMVVGAEQMRDELLDENESTGPLFKIKQDPRVTRVGRVLRKLSLDELPQLINVLRGEMSLVGPRPFVVHEDEKIEGWARRRLDLTPGITGVWQVMGRNDIGFEEMIKLDYLYVTNWSLWWDIKLVLRTLPIILLRRGY
ncbi:MAG: sugar transferase [Thermoleophilia bacterium]